MALRVGLCLRTAATCAAAVACLAAPAAALADHPFGSVDGEVPAAVEQALGGEVSELPSGLYEVDPRRGPPLTTHGPDLRGEIKPNHGSGLGPGDPERPPVCATDYYQHVLYARRATDPDDYATAKPLIQATMRRINAVLHEESLESGGVNADYKVLCEAGGEIKVDQFVVSSNGTSFSAVVSAADAAGFDDPNADYTIFFEYDHPSICGVGHFTADESLSADNANNSGGNYGVTYDGCWNGTATMHENGHNQGAVQYNAPFSTGTGAHCWDENDVMCYSPDGGNLHQEGTISRCNDRLHFDCGNDDYFDVAPESCEYLATHWNLGSPFNRFIVFGAATNTPPCASFARNCSQLQCSFADSSSDPEGTVATRSWDFGDGATSTAASPSHSYASPGTYTVTLTVTDAAGGSDSEAATVTPTDSTPPDTSITAQPKDRTGKRQATFEFSSSEAGSTFECSLDSAAFSVCTSPHTVKVKRGRHNFDVRATDGAGNVDAAPATDGWKVKRKKG